MDETTISASDALPLDFDAWADLSARLLERDEEARLDIFAAASIDPGDFGRCDEHWSMEIARDITAGRMARAERYGAACADELRRRKEPPPTEEVAPEQAAAPAPPAAPVVEAAPPVALPPIMPLPVPPPAPAAVLPAADTPMPPAIAPPRAARDADEHTVIAASPFAAGALPFGKDPSPGFTEPRPGPDQRPQEPGPAPVPAPAPKVDLGTTAAPTMLSPFAALPFQGAAAQEAAPAVTRFTLQSYASLCAELSVAPDKAAEILLRYGITDEAGRLTLDEAWRVKLAASSAMRQEMQTLYNHYREWLSRQAR